MRANSVQIANEFIREAKRMQLDPRTHLQLQKLCYLAHGWFLAYEDEPLFVDSVEAWRWGPVMPALYKSAKMHGAEPITDALKSDEFDTARLSDEDSPLSGRECRKIRGVVRAVLAKYGNRTGAQLTNLTHVDGSPWDKATRRAGGEAGPGVPIQNDLIQSYFKSYLPDKSG